MKKTFKPIVTLIAVFLVAVLLASMICATDYYDSYGTAYYFAQSNPYYTSDYALVTCDEFGGGFEYTDFVASTNGCGTNTYNWTKVVCVKVYFYDNDDAQTIGRDRLSIPYYDNNNESAIVYGESYVNYEYGLDVFTSFHKVIMFDDRYIDNETGCPIIIDSKTIVIDTTGLY
ncbi:MAG: hypothetical protein J6V48_01515 [Clostridia bacterium]|nr:hypothetical protein [Clostridia bacterium]